jgi:predicted aspartyl protease
MRIFLIRLGLTAIAIALLPANFGRPGNTSTFAFDWRKGMIFVPVRVDGSRPLSFVLDTGSTRNLIDRTLATSLGLKSSGTGSLQGAGAGRIPVAFIHDVRIALPGLESAGYEFSTADLQPLAASLGERVDGILGYEVFCRFVVTVDYRAKRLTFTPPAAFRPPGGSAQVLPIELRDKWAFVKAELVLPGAVTVQDSFLIDSGSSDAVDHPIVMNLQSRTPATSGVGLGAPVQGATAQATSFRLGLLRGRSNRELLWRDRCDEPAYWE